MDQHSSGGNSPHNLEPSGASSSRVRSGEAAAQPGAPSPDSHREGVGFVAVEWQPAIRASVTAKREPERVAGPAGGASWRPPRKGGGRSSDPGFSVAFSRALGTVVVTVRGVLDGRNSRQLRYILWDLVDQQGNRKVVVDLRDVNVAEGVDTDVFAQAAHSARKRGGHLTLSGPAEVTSKVLWAGLSDLRDADHQ